MTGVCNVTLSEGNEIFERIAIETNGDVFDFAPPIDEYSTSTTPKIDVTTTTHKPTTETNNVDSKQPNRSFTERKAKMAQQIESLKEMDPEQMKMFSKYEW